MVQNQETLKVVNMYVWRATRRETERREEAVNRELLHRQHKN